MTPLGWRKENGSRWKLPHKAGLYAIFSRLTNQLLYIGKTTNLHNRLTKANDDPGYGMIRRDIGVENLYIKYKLTNWLFTEKSLIKRLKPKYNILYNNKHRKWRTN